MSKRIVSEIMLTLLLMSLLVFALDTQLVKADPKTIYVDNDNTSGPWDGTSNHPYRDITSALGYASEGDTIYVYSGTYYENIVANKTVSLVGENIETTIIDGGAVGNVMEVTADNVTITGFTIRNSGKEWPNSGIALVNAKNCNVSRNKITDNWQGIRISENSNNSSISRNNITNNRDGIMLYFSSNNSISENDIKTKNGFGIFLHHSSRNSISGNNIANNMYGIELDFVSNYNLISGNTITNNGDGIRSDHSSLNTLSGNNITANNQHGLRLSGNSDYNSMWGNKIANNLYGIRIERSANNKIFHNNFVENQRHAITQVSYGNFWDDDYLSGGNYWSDYDGVDADSDGIGDTPNLIDANDIDRYPLVGSFNTFDVGVWDDLQYYIDIVSDSTVSKFQLNRAERTISFNIMDSDYMLGFCRITIANIIIEDFWQGEYTVLVDRQPVEFRNWTETENTYIHFTYQDSEHQVTIMQKSALAINLLTFMVLIVIAAAFIALAIIAVVFKKRKISKEFRVGS